MSRTSESDDLQRCLYGKGRHLRLARETQTTTEQSGQQDTPQFQPMMEYISQLRHSLSQAEDSHTIFQEFGGNLRSLKKVLAVCKINQEELKAAKATGAMQGVVTPIGPVLTSATAVKNFDRPNRALTV